MSKRSSVGSADRLSAQLSKNETISKKGQKMALGGSDARLVFRKRVYRHVHDIPNDPIEYHLLYAEAVNKVVKVDWGFSVFLWNVCKGSWLEQKGEIGCKDSAVPTLELMKDQQTVCVLTVKQWTLPTPVVCRERVIPVYFS